MKVVKRQPLPAIAGAIRCEDSTKAAIIMMGLCFQVWAVSSRSLRPVNHRPEGGLAGPSVLAIERGRPQVLKMRRGGRVVDRVALEMRSTRKRTGGSNPSLSASLRSASFGWLTPVRQARRDRARLSSEALAKEDWCNVRGAGVSSNSAMAVFWRQLHRATRLQCLLPVDTSSTRPSKTR